MSTHILKDIFEQAQAEQLSPARVCELAKDVGIPLREVDVIVVLAGLTDTPAPEAPEPEKPQDPEKLADVCNLTDEQVEFIVTGVIDGMSSKDMAEIFADMYDVDVDDKIINTMIQRLGLNVPRKYGINRRSLKGRHHLLANQELVSKVLKFQKKTA